MTILFTTNIARPRGTSTLAVTEKDLRLLQEILNFSLNAYFDVYTGDLPANIDQFNLVTKNELTHYAFLFGSSQLLNLSNYLENKESQLWSLLLNFLDIVKSIPAEWGL